VEYVGPALKSMQRAYWQVRIWDNKNKATAWSEPAFWEMGIIEPQSWSASWITMENEQEMEGSKPAHYYRKEFSVRKKVSTARVYVTSLGIYELHLNGKKVGDDLFTPGWTSYNKRLQYQTYNVTNMLRAENAIGAIVGDGWYRGTITTVRGRPCYGEKLALLVQLVINYTDGTSETITTDKNWKVTNKGPILESDIYNGEKYNANLEMPGWSSAGFKDEAWQPVALPGHPMDILVAPQGVPVKAIEEIRPEKLFTTPKGEIVFDMGQNMVGWVRLKVKGNKGDVVVLKFAEVLDKEGNFYMENLRAANCTDTYLLKGEGEEIYEPAFTFHGFRFVQIEGLKNPSLDQITGVVIHSDMTPTGSFVCSDPMINQLQKNIVWGQKGNFLDVPTDCPQRDERMGWTGDIQVFSPTAAFNFDVAAFFTRWSQDLAADQLPNGMVTDVVPDNRFGRGGSTAWGDAAIIVPWTNYLVYGDKRILEVQYPSMKGWVDYMTSRAGDDHLWTGDKHYGDWLAFATTRSDYPGATTEKDLIATAYYRYSSNLLAKIAKIIGNDTDAGKYSELSENIKRAFISEFVTPAGRLVSNTQTAYVLALSFDLLPDELVPKSAAYLADDVRKMGHLTTGFVGTPLLCKALSDHGYADLAFMLLNRKEYPSWLYPVTQGATTIWERWDGQKPDGTFQTTGMNSFNHYAYGAIGEWLYTYVAGIRMDEQNPAYKHFYLAPQPGGGLTHAKAEFKSVYGKISSNWEISEGNFNYQIEIPANTTAAVTLPGAKLEAMNLSAAMQKGAVQRGDVVELKLGSGSYTFRYAMQAAN
jgi:alpha-L-rhamnosidase